MNIVLLAFLEVIVRFTPIDSTTYLLLLKLNAIQYVIVVSKTKQKKMIQ